MLKVIAHNRQAIKSLGGYPKSLLILQARLLQLGRGHACPGPLFLVHMAYSQATVQFVLLEIAISVKELLNILVPGTVKIDTFAVFDMLMCVICDYDIILCIHSYKI